MQYRYLRNEIKALFQFLQIERQAKVPFEWRFFVYKVKVEIEITMEDALNSMKSEAKGEKESKIDVKKVYQFSKTLQTFIESVEQTSDKCLDFWRELLKRADFNSNTFHVIGTEIAIGS